MGELVVHWLYDMNQELRDVLFGEEPYQGTNTNLPSAVTYAKLRKS